MKTEDAPSEAKAMGGVEAAARRYVAVKPSEAAQRLGYEIIGYVEAMKMMGIERSKTFDLIVDLIKRLRKADPQSKGGSDD